MATRARRQHPFLDWDGPIAFAHRGGASDAPENTMPAFQRAIDLGYRYLETDVHATADGEVVAFHDDDLSRTCGRPGVISQLPWREVATARVHGAEPIPRLVDLLEEWPTARLNIDCKHPSAIEPLVRVLQRADALDRVLIGAFDDRRLLALRRQLGPGLCTSAGPGEVLTLAVSGWMPASAHAVQVPVRFRGIPVVRRRFIRHAHARGLDVHVWTIDDAVEMRQLLDLGVDGLITDRPAVLRDVLLSRGQWP